MGDQPVDDAVADNADIVEFIGVYDADATLSGEIAYWVGARLGRRHCSLCEITHGMFTRRREWTSAAAELPVPFHAHHRDDAPGDVIALAAGRYPLVVARRRDGDLQVVLDAERLDGLDGSPEGLRDVLMAACDASM
jgi:hypothetical protein